MIAKQSSRLSQITEEVLLTSSLNSGEVHVLRHAVDVREVIRSAIEAIAAPFPDAPITVELADELGAASGDPDRIQQVLVNLLDNALKYGGSGPVQIRAETTAEVVRISVADSGPGILPADRERIFEKFFRADPQMTYAPSGTGLGFFQAQHPDRYYDVGIAEEHAALFACGLATQGLKPFLTIYSTFMQRAYDMIIHDIALQNLNVALCMDRAGLSGDDGPTHHGLFDIGYLRHVPNIVHMQPKDEDEFADMLWTMVHYNSGPIAVRYPRGAGTGARPKATPKLLEIRKAEVVQPGKDMAIFGLGNMFEMAQEAAQKLEAQGFSVALINPRWIKPLDTGTLEFFARSVQVLCTIEDHVLHNGFGCAVMEHLHTQMINTPVVRIGWPDQFIEHGNIPVLRQKHGLTSDALFEKVLPLLRKRVDRPRSSAA